MAMAPFLMHPALLLTTLTCFFGFLLLSCSNLFTWDSWDIILNVKHCAIVVPWRTFGDTCSTFGCSETETYACLSHYAKYLLR